MNGGLLVNGFRSLSGIQPLLVTVVGGLIDLSIAFCAATQCSQFCYYSFVFSPKTANDDYTCSLNDVV